MRAEQCTGITVKDRQCLLTGGAIKYPRPGGTVLERCVHHQDQTRTFKASLLDSSDEDEDKDNRPSERRGRTPIPVETMARLEFGSPTPPRPIGANPVLAFEQKLESRHTTNEEAILGKPMVEARDRQLKASASHKPRLRQLLSPTSDTIPTSSKIDTLAHVAASGMERLNLHDADAHLLAEHTAEINAAVSQHTKLWKEQNQHNLSVNNITRSADKRLGKLELQHHRHGARIKLLEEQTAASGDDDETE
jgi:hypothetical protein